MTQGTSNRKAGDPKRRIPRACPSPRPDPLPTEAGGVTSGVVQCCSLAWRLRRGLRQQPLGCRGMGQGGTVKATGRAQHILEQGHV